MTASTSLPRIPDRDAIPAQLLLICFALLVVNLAMLPAMYLSHAWIFDAEGRGIPTDFVNVWSAGRLALDGHPAQAWDWEIQKQVQVAMLGQTYVGHFAWHYPPPFLLIAKFLAQFSYGVALPLWAGLSLIPYLIMIRATLGRPFGWLLAAGFPVVLANVLVGQNGFLTAALIGGTLVLLPARPILAGICLGLLSYKPQYGVLFPLVLIVTAQWRAFISAGVTAVVLAAISWIAFGTESWQAFVHWMPMWSQSVFTEGNATWFKMQSVFGLVRFLGGSEHIAWICQWTMSGTVVVAVVALWHSNARYALKAAALATGTLLLTPYLFLYDMMVLAIPVTLLIRLGLDEGFARYELAGLGIAAALLVAFPLFSAPIALGSTLIVAVLIMRRAGAFWRGLPTPSWTVARA
jgi:arabinofuranan 3-O-arabinosyltransferase